MIPTRRYFIATLALPLLIVLIGVIYAVVFTHATAGNISMLMTPYCCFFVFMLYWSLNHAPKQIRRAAYRAPLIFLAFQSAYLIVEYVAGVSPARDLVGLAGLLSIVAVYVIIVGYLYTLIMEQGYFSYLEHKRHLRSANTRLRC
ncbi:MAG: hypothetical protein L0Z73_19335 [Gammaproteobacteria bacterium]|nr:hypothetical protein [Gammaproteobacteria bacterium]